MAHDDTVTVILFPHTYLNGKGWEKLRPYFERVSICQPDEYQIPPTARGLSDQGKLQVRIPIKEKREELRSFPTSIR